MSNKLRIIDNIKILEEHDNVAMACQLICDCGCNHFIIFHTGKVTKGILASYLLKKNKQLVIRAVCKDCGKSIIIFDSEIDGIKPIMRDTYPEEKFLLKNINENFEIRLKYNYYSKDYKTNKFVDCFIEIKNDDMKKIKQLYEDKNMNKISKNIIECLLGSLVVLLFSPLLSPATNPWYEIYLQPLYWLFGVIGSIVISSVIVYFLDINPREFYHIINVVPVSIFLTILTLSMITSLVLIAVIENVVIKIALLVLLTLLFFISIYVLMHRGVCIYKNGKISIFKFKIKTYDASKIDDIIFEYANKKCNIIIVINGFKEEFKLSSFSAKMIENRLKRLMS